MSITGQGSAIAEERLLSYEEFRTGLTYQDVQGMMWSASDDPKDWRYTGRSGVLGYWRELKIQMYNQYRSAAAAHGVRE